MWPFNDDLMRFDFECDDDIAANASTPLLNNCAIESKFMQIMHT